MRICLIQVGTSSFFFSHAAQCVSFGHSFGKVKVPALNITRYFSRANIFARTFVSFLSRAHWLTGIIMVMHEKKNGHACRRLSIETSLRDRVLRIKCGCTSVAIMSRSMIITAELCVIIMCRERVKESRKLDNTIRRAKGARFGWSADTDDHPQDVWEVRAVATHFSPGGGREVFS